MRIPAAITLAVCAVTVSGCSRWWCSCPDPQQYDQGASYDPVPRSNSYESYVPPPTNSYGADPRSRSADPYLASPPPRYSP
jgi:hypothetical protein